MNTTSQQTSPWQYKWGKEGLKGEEEGEGFVRLKWKGMITREAVSMTGWNN